MADDVSTILCLLYLKFEAQLGRYPTSSQKRRMEEHEKLKYDGSDLETDTNVMQAEPMSAPDYGDDIDQGTFEQILEMDEDEGDREFSSSIVFGFFDQADQTFNQMQDAL